MRKRMLPPGRAAKRCSRLPSRQSWPCAVQALSYSTSPEEQRALTRALSDLCVDAACRGHIAHQFALRPALAGQLLANPDAKVRKNTAELLGRMDADAHADALIAAYRAEEIDFIKPSLLLALGSAHKNEAARAFLASLPPLEAGEAKHQRAQRDALSKAQDSLSPRAFVPVPDAPMQKPRDLLLTCPNARLAAEELSSLGWDARAFDAKSGLTLVKNARAFLPVYRARAFYEAGILLFESDSLFHAVHGLTQPLVCRNVKNLYGRLDLSYRLDVVGPTITRDERLRAYRAVQDALATSPLHNSPSSYDFTLSILCLGRRFAAVLFPGSQNDTRFAYRKQAVSASMHPAVAAACCRVLAPYAQENSRVPRLLLRRGRPSCWNAPACRMRRLPGRTSPPRRCASRGPMPRRPACPPTCSSRTPRIPSDTPIPR